MCGRVMERSWKYLSDGILLASKLEILQLVEQKQKSALKFLGFRYPTLFGETRGS
jgi:hypothetical protein